MKAIKKPDFMKNAILGNGHSAAFELICALLVFFVGSTATSLVQAPVLAFYMLKDGSYMKMLQNGSLDVNQMNRIMQSIPDWFVIVTLIAEFALLIICILYCKLIEKRNAASMGFQKKGFAIQYIKGLLIGAAAFVVAYGICILTKSVTIEGFNKDSFSILYLFGFLVGFLVQGMAEEVLCRGYLFVSLTRRNSVVGAVVISSLFFSMMHGMNDNMSLLAYLNLFLFGAVMALLMLRYENIWIVGAAHSIWNFVQGTIFGVSVSGIQIKRTVFVGKSVEGASFINGGKFGLEGGLSVTLVLLAGIGILVWSLYRKGMIISIEEDLELYTQEEQERLRRTEKERKAKEEFMQKMMQNMTQNPYFTNPNANSNQEEEKERENPFEAAPNGQNPNNGFDNTMQQRTDETGDFGAMIQQSQQKEESMQKQNQKATPDNVQDTGFDHNYFDD